MPRSNQDEAPRPPAPVMLSADQFETLLQQLSMQQHQSDREHQNVSPLPLPAHVSGNFTKCTSRFNGSADADVEAFIDAITTFKDCAQVSDANALAGLPILFEGVAATWWKGVKSTVPDWKSALDVLREAYSKRLPPHLIFREMFSCEQRFDENCELYICNFRSLVAQLPYQVPEQMQLDMLYGLLNRSIRKRITRNSFDTYNCLLKQTRDIEQSLREIKQSQPVEQVDKSSKKPRPRCNFCRNFGHLETECRNKAATRQKELSKEKTKPTSTTTKPESTKTDEKPRLVCYGCGTPGHIRSNCPNCSATKGVPSTPKTETLSFNMTSISSNTTQDRPLLPIQIAGFNGSACLDTGSKSSIAGARLYKILTELDYPHVPKNLTITVADAPQGDSM